MNRRCEVGENCSGMVVAHHDDYGKPDEVRFLCSRHHQLWHRDNGHAEGWYEGMTFSPMFIDQEAVKLYLPTEDAQTIREIAKAEDRSVANVLRRAVRAYV